MSYAKKDIKRMSNDEIFNLYLGGSEGSAGSSAEADTTGNAAPMDYSTYKEKALSQNSSLLNQKNQLLESTYASQNAGLAQSLKNTQQGLSVANEKLNKYLQQSHLSSGLATGQTGSDFINANNAYMQNRAKTANDFIAQQNELMNMYMTGKLQNKQEAYSNEQAIIDKYIALERQAEQEAYNRQQDEYQKTNSDQMYAAGQLESILSNGLYIDGADFEQKVEQMKDKLSETDYRHYKILAEYLKNSPDIVAQKEQEEADIKAYEEAIKEDEYKKAFSGDQYSYGKNVKVTDNGLLAVTVDGQQMYAYEELTDVNGAVTPSVGGFPGAAGGLFGLINKLTSSERKAEVEKWVGAAQAGLIPDGAVMDIKSGSLNMHVMYYQGKFYLVGNQPGKAMSGFGD